MEENRIRAKVRERLRTGVLPKDLPPADPEGEPLEACAYPSGRVLRFHGWCYKAWNDERAAL
jgi:hypothetical protein